MDSQKIYKSEIIQDVVKKNYTEYIELLYPEDLTFRPIVAGPSCETNRLSNLLDILLTLKITYILFNIYLSKYQKILF